MRFLLPIISLLIFNFAHAKQDYCKYALATAPGLVGYGDYWTIDNKGKFSFDEKIKAEDFSKDSYARKGRVITLERNPVLGRYRRSVLTLDNLGQLDTVSLHHKTAAEERSNPVARVMKFERRNGVCVPVSSQIQSPGGSPESSRDIIYNTKMCKELKDYLTANPKALICSCGDSETNSAIQNILEKHYSFYSPKNDAKYGANKPLDKSVDIDDHFNTNNLNMVAKLSTPLFAAMLQLDKCQSDPGAGRALEDASIWENSPVESARTQPQTTGKKSK